GLGARRPRSATGLSRRCGLVRRQDGVYRMRRRDLPARVAACSLAPLSASSKTPAARLQAAIGLRDAIASPAPAKAATAVRIRADWFRASRFAVSKDRRAIRELVYRAIRHCGPVPQTGRAAMLALAQEDPSLMLQFDGSGYGPAPVEEGE